uniref:Uncharacterized protein n=1 Tax=Romanomermis culicivorax TaxID=13658 RepID=A0A915HWE4_ROMCU
KNYPEDYYDTQQILKKFKGILYNKIAKFRGSRDYVWTTYKLAQRRKQPFLTLEKYSSHEQRNVDAFSCNLAPLLTNVE